MAGFNQLLTVESLLNYASRYVVIVQTKDSSSVGSVAQDMQPICRPYVRQET